MNLQQNYLVFGSFDKLSHFWPHTALWQIIPFLATYCTSTNYLIFGHILHSYLLVLPIHWISISACQIYIQISNVSYFYSIFDIFILHFQIFSLSLDIHHKFVIMAILLVYILHVLGWIKKIKYRTIPPPPPPSSCLLCFRVQFHLNTKPCFSTFPSLLSPGNIC